MVGKLILGLGSVAGGALATWRLAQEIAEWGKLGPPAWWVVWRYPIEKYADLPTDKSRLAALRVFRWNRDRWVPLTPCVYTVASDVSYLTQTPPDGRLLFAQITWTKSSAKVPWTVKVVRYASGAKDKLPR